jgi:hypothetical protein
VTTRVENHPKPKTIDNFLPHLASTTTKDNYLKQLPRKPTHQRQLHTEGTYTPKKTSHQWQLPPKGTTHQRQLHTKGNNTPKATNYTRKTTTHLSQLHTKGDNTHKATPKATTPKAHLYTKRQLKAKATTHQRELHTKGTFTV